jgi:hypothetical protein
MVTPPLEVKVMVEVFALNVILVVVVRSHDTPEPVMVIDEEPRVSVRTLEFEELNSPHEHV